MNMVDTVQILWGWGIGCADYRAKANGRSPKSILGGRGSLSA